MSATTQPPAKPRNAAETPTVSAQAWYAVGVMMVCYTLSFIDRQILSTFVDPIKADFAITDQQFSYLQGFAFAFFYTFIGLPLGRWVDKTNRRNLIVGGVLVWSFFTTSCAFATDFTTLFISRMGVGVGEATLGPAAFSIMADLFPRQRMGVAASVFYWGTLLGAGLSLLIGGAVRVAAPTMTPWNIPFAGEVTGWRLVFVLLGIPGMLFALLVFTIKEPKRKAMALAADGTVSRASWGETFDAIKLRWQSVLGVSLAFAFQAAANYGFMGWAFAHFERDYAWGPGDTSQALGFLMITCGVGGLYAGGWLSDYLHRKGVNDAPLIVAVICAVGVATFLAASMFVPSAGLSLALAAPGIFCIALPMGTASAAVTYLFPNQYRGLVTAMYLFILNIGGMPIGNAMPGFINTQFFNDQKVGVAAGMTIFVCGLIMLAIILATRKKYREHYALIPH